MYTEELGFQKEPFSPTADVEFFYAAPTYRAAYERLVFSIQNRKGLLALLGEAGTGKTTLLRWLMHNIEPNVQFVYFFNTDLTFEEMLIFVCDDLGLPAEGVDRVTKIKNLYNFLHTQFENGGTGVFLIDEAQNLSDEFLEHLRLLSNAETAGEKLLQIVLAGQPELERKLSHPHLRQLKQRITTYCRLKPLDAQEVGPFINHRLQVAGYTGEPLFPGEVIQRIAHYSHGIPRLINTLCENTLIALHATGKTVASVQLIDEMADELNLSSDQATPNQAPPQIHRPDQHRTPGIVAAAAPPPGAYDKDRDRRAGVGNRSATHTTPPSRRPSRISCPQFPVFSSAFSSTRRATPELFSDECLGGGSPPFVSRFTWWGESAA
jgi:type II secretory pathway predicted ATPase ExeA